MTTQSSLRDHAEKIIEDFFEEVGQKMPLRNMYDVVMSEVEQPLLEVAMRYTRGDFDKAAQILGVSTDELKEKLKKYGLYS